MGHMATMLSERPQDSLPSTSEVNPRREGIEHCKAITMRSGNEVVTLGSSLVIVKEPKQSYQSKEEIDIVQEDWDQSQLNSFVGKQP